MTAIDGTTLCLPSTLSVRNEFGTHKGGGKNNQSQTEMAQMLIQYDLMSHLVTKAEIYPIKKPVMKITGFFYVFYVYI